jgi:hypothetical protein
VLINALTRHPTSSRQLESLALARTTRLRKPPRQELLVGHKRVLRGENCPWRPRSSQCKQRPAWAASRLGTALAASRRAGRPMRLELREECRSPSVIAVQLFVSCNDQGQGMHTSCFPRQSQTFLLQNFKCHPDSARLSGECSLESGPFVTCAMRSIRIKSRRKRTCAIMDKKTELAWNMCDNILV